MCSEARRANSNLRTDNLTDQLAVVLKPDGTRSDVYPHNLHSLFAYSGAYASTKFSRMLTEQRADEMLEVLLKDHELAVNEVREKNLNRFMAHIGTRIPATSLLWTKCLYISGVGFRLVPIPGMPGTNEAKDDSCLSPI